MSSILLPSKINWEVARHQLSYFVHLGHSKPWAVWDTGDVGLGDHLLLQRTPRALLVLKVPHCPRHGQHSIRIRDWDNAKKNAPL